MYRIGWRTRKAKQVIWSLRLYQTISEMQAQIEIWQAIFKQNVYHFEKVN